MADASSKLGKIFIGGLSYETTDDKLRSYFGAYGLVTDAVVMKDPISRRSRGFGFITYADPSCVDRALTQSNHVLDSRRVEAKRAVPRAENARDSSGNLANKGAVNTCSTPSASSATGATKKIFVGGLHYETKDADFKKYFEQYGNVVSAEVMFNRETNKSRGFGFVVFDNENCVDYVLQNRNHVIDGKAVEVKRAVPRTDVSPSRSTGTISRISSALHSPIRAGHLSNNQYVDNSVIDQPSVKPHKSYSVNGATSSGILGGYAAAVRYGGQAPPSNLLGSQLSESSASIDSNNLGEDKSRKSEFSSAAIPEKSKLHSSFQHASSQRGANSQSHLNNEVLGSSDYWHQHKLHPDASNYHHFSHLPVQPNVQWAHVHLPEWKRKWNEPLDKESVSNVLNQESSRLAQPSFFSMFSNSTDNIAAGTSFGYRPWDNGYGSSSLGMGIGMGMGLSFSNARNESSIIRNGSFSNINSPTMYGFEGNQGLLQANNFNSSDKEIVSEAANLGIMNGAFDFCSAAAESEAKRSEHVVPANSNDDCSVSTESSSGGCSQVISDCQFSGFQ